MYPISTPASDRFPGLRRLFVIALFALLGLAPLQAQSSSLVLLDAENFGQGSLTNAPENVEVAELGSSRFVTAHPVHDWSFEKIELRTWAVDRSGATSLLDTYQHTLGSGQTASVVEVQSLGPNLFALARRTTSDRIEVTTWNVGTTGTISQADTWSKELITLGRFEMAALGSDRLFLLYRASTGFLRVHRLNLFVGLIMNDAVLLSLSDSDDWAIDASGSSSIAIARAHDLLQYTLTLYSYSNNQLVQVATATSAIGTAEKVDVVHLGDGAIAVARNTGISGVRVDRWQKLWLPPNGTFLVNWATAAASTPSALAFSVAKLSTSKAVTAVLGTDNVVRILTWDPLISAAPLTSATSVTGLNVDLTHLGTSRFVTAVRRPAIPPLRIETWMDTVP